MLWSKNYIFCSKILLLLVLISSYCKLLLSSNYFANFRVCERDLDPILGISILVAKFRGYNTGQYKKTKPETNGHYLYVKLNIQTKYECIFFVSRVL